VIAAAELARENSSLGASPGLLRRRARAQKCSQLKKEPSWLNDRRRSEPALFFQIEQFSGG
jgi:hypothetical protein